MGNEHSNELCLTMHITFFMEINCIKKIEKYSLKKLQGYSMPKKFKITKLVIIIYLKIKSRR